MILHLGRPAAAATPATVQAQHAQVAAALSHHMTTAESFSGGVSKDVVGGKRYWHTAFIELMAMAVEYGIPQFFGTFTANESGWADVTQACAGVDAALHTTLLNGNPMVQQLLTCFEREEL